MQVLYMFFHLCICVLYYYFAFAALAWFLHPSIIFRGKMGASLHRSSKGQAIGGKPPYLRVNHFKNLATCLIMYIRFSHTHTHTHIYMCVCYDRLMVCICDVFKYKEKYAFMYCITNNAFWLQLFNVKLNFDTISFTFVHTKSSIRNV